MDVLSVFKYSVNFLVNIHQCNVSFHMERPLMTVSFILYLYVGKLLDVTSCRTSKLHQNQYV